MLRWNSYRSNDQKFQRGENCIEDHLFQHIYSEGHEGFLKNISITIDR